MSLFGDFGPSYLGMPAEAVAGGEIQATVQDFVTGTSTGANDFTTAALGGETPKAILAIGTNNRASAGTSETAGLGFTVLAVDDTDGVGLRLAAPDGSTSFRQSLSFNGETNNPFSIRDSTTHNSATASLIAGGLRLSMDINAVSNRCSFVAFYGDAVAADVAAIELAGTAPIPIACGFRPDAVIMFGTSHSLGGVAVGFAYSIGVATGVSDQRCVLASQAGSSPMQAILTDALGGGLFTDGQLTYSFAIDSFSDTGFSITPSALINSHGFGYLALDLGGGRAKILDYTTPTATGTQAITGVGFTPAFAIAILTNLEATDPAYPVSSSDLMSGLSINLIGDEQWASSFRTDNGANDTGSLRLEKAILGASSSATDAIQATLTSFDADGLTLDYSAVAGTAKKGFILCFE